MAEGAIGEVYKRHDRLWDWRVRARNGEIIATSGGQGFTERNDAAEALIRAGLLMDSIAEIRDV
jgi:uncharacterized protein YegP (UPF0339 family)